MMNQVRDELVIADSGLRCDTFNFVVVRPPPGVNWAVQSGRKDLIEPGEVTDVMIAFDLNLTVRVGAPRANGQPNLPRTSDPRASRRSIRVPEFWDASGAGRILPGSAGQGATRGHYEAVGRARPAPARMLGPLRMGGPPACATIALLDGDWRVVTPT